MLLLLVRLLVVVVLLSLWLLLLVLLELNRGGPIQRLLLHLDHGRRCTMLNRRWAGMVKSGRLHWRCLCCRRRQVGGRVDDGVSGYRS